MHTETLNTPAKITDFTRDVGALGGTLTLSYPDAVVTLSGDDLIFAADDYEFAPFTIVTDVLDDVPELTEAENTATVSASSDERFYGVTIAIVALLTSFTALAIFTL